MGSKSNTPFLRQLKLGSINIGADQLVNIVMMLSAIAAFALLGRRAFSGLDTNWDALAYHLPFAARHVGLCDQQCMILSASLEARFLGFPPLANMVQGLLWKLFGTPHATNLASLSALLLLILYLRRFWSIPIQFAALALLTIPMVQIMATSSYIDLMVNVAAAIAVLSILALILHPERLSWKSHAVAIISLVFLGNSKTQMMPVALLLSGIYFAFMNFYVPLERRGTWSVTGKRKPGIIVISVVSLLILASGLKNLLFFGNPVYPVSLSILGVTLPGVEGYPAPNSIPVHLQNTSGPLRWLLSVLEVSAFDSRPTPWTIDQGSVEQSAASFRMGGYFVAYVIATLAFLVVGASRLPAKSRNPIVITLLLLSVLVACLPASHELRYYMFWIMVLVAVNLYIYFSPVCAEFKERDTLSKVALASIIVCFLSVICLSGGRYFVKSPSAEEIIVGLGIRSKIDNNIKDGDKVCVIDKEPFSFLYTSLFHPKRHYLVRSDNNLDLCSAALR